MQDKKCERCGTRVAWAGIGTNLLLVSLKILVGLVSGSWACIADSLHSAANLISAVAILVSHNVSKRPTTNEFPFGYGKAEFLAAALTSLFVLAGAIAILIVSIEHLVKVPTGPPHLSALLMGLVSIGANEILFRFMQCAGTELKSQTIMANAWANRANSFSSVAVIIGVLGAQLGFYRLDPIAALLVVAVIVRVSFKILYESVKAVMDYSANDDYGLEIQEIVERMSDVEGVAELRTRLVGRKIWVELDIFIDPRKTISEGQEIARQVKKTLLGANKDLERVWVQFKPAEING
ncbi:MAG: cation transporter [Deltaproteobacteria bacterium]|nr:cation transporter [Deltaproteobacteria bacterium]